MVGAVSNPGPNRKEHCGCAVSGKTGQASETFTVVSPKKRAARARARPPVLWSFGHNGKSSIVLPLSLCDYFCNVACATLCAYMVGQRSTEQNMQNWVNSTTQRWKDGIILKMENYELGQVSLHSQMTPSSKRRTTTNWATGHPLGQTKI